MENDRAIIIGVGVSIALIILLVFATNTNQPKDSSAAISSSLSSLTLDHTTFNFGRVSMAKGVVRHSFPIKNTSQKPVKLAKLFTSCMCTTAQLTSASRSVGPFGMPGHGAIPTFDFDLAPGESANIDVVFDPAAHGPAGVGRVERDVILEDAQGGSVQASFAAVVAP